MAKNPYKGRDEFAERAAAEGYLARSVYKLKEIDRRFRVLRQGMRVVDLGCSPGSWSRYAFERVGRNGVIVGVDINPPKMSTGPFLLKSILEIDPEELGELLGGPADVVLSDMAPKTTGVSDADHYRQIALARAAFDAAVTLLASGGSFVVKIFEGEETAEYQRMVKARFAKLKRVRPEAVRKNSREFYMVAMGFRDA